MGLKTCPFVKECDKAWADPGGCRTQPCFPEEESESYKTCPIYEFGCLVNNRTLQKCILELRMDGGEAERLREVHQMEVPEC